MHQVSNKNRLIRMVYLPALKAEWAIKLGAEFLLYFNEDKFLKEADEILESSQCPYDSIRVLRRKHEQEIIEALHEQANKKETR